jgi:hypothetical protein
MWDRMNKLERLCCPEQVLVGLPIISYVAPHFPQTRLWRPSHGRICCCLFLLQQCRDFFGRVVQQKKKPADRGESCGSVGYGAWILTWRIFAKHFNLLAHNWKLIWEANNSLRGKCVSICLLVPGFVLLMRFGRPGSRGCWWDCYG